MLRRIAKLAFQTGHVIARVAMLCASFFFLVGAIALAAPVPWLMWGMTASLAAAFGVLVARRNLMLATVAAYAGVLLTFVAGHVQLALSDKTYSLLDVSGVAGGLAFFLFFSWIFGYLAINGVGAGGLKARSSG